MFKKGESFQGLVTVQIKPLSVNKAYQGKRFRTPEYDRYQEAVMLMLPTFNIPPSLLKLVFEFGFSNTQADADNPCKLFTDILQKKYGFNDSRVYEIVIRKAIVPKGQEYIKFNILPFNQELTFMN
jgi:Holliday junction resolvase RusA-like endonuclease